MASEAWALFVHTYEVQTVRKSKGKGDTYRVETRHRYVCACGWASRWWRVRESARRETAAHVLDGQTARLP